MPEKILLARTKAIYVTVDYTDIWFTCLQCFDPVGWAAGRASGLCEKVVGCWCGCLEQGADFHMAQLTSLPLTVSCFSKIQTGFTFLVPAHLGSPGKRVVKRVCCFTQKLKMDHSHLDKVITRLEAIMAKNLASALFASICPISSSSLKAALVHFQTYSYCLSMRTNLNSI